ncbi:transposase [Paramuribaculum intestinale]|uniref:transposase n=1 Tax=Paramuribaculum intestinale TaxID=2094151 RepID=UPI00272C7E3F|nr:transposase [Paramuribaculum intestinale]
MRNSKIYGRTDERTGCQWRMILGNFAPWESVYYYFNKWKNNKVRTNCNKSETKKREFPLL